MVNFWKEMYCLKVGRHHRMSVDFFFYAPNLGLMYKGICTGMVFTSYSLMLLWSRSETPQISESLQTDLKSKECTCRQAACPTLYCKCTLLSYSFFWDSCTPQDHCRLRECGYCIGLNGAAAHMRRNKIFAASVFFFFFPIKAVWLQAVFR